MLPSSCFVMSSSLMTSKMGSRSHSVILAVLIFLSMMMCVSTTVISSAAAADPSTTTSSNAVAPSSCAILDQRSNFTTNLQRWNATIYNVTDGQVAIDNEDVLPGLSAMLRASVQSTNNITTNTYTNVTEANVTEAMLMMMSTMQPILVEEPRAVVAVLRAMEPLVREGGISTEMATNMDRGIGMVSALDSIADEFPMSILTDSLTLAQSLSGDLIDGEAITRLYDAARPLLLRLRDPAIRENVAETIAPSITIPDGITSFLLGATNNPLVANPIFLNSMLSPLVIQATIRPYVPTYTVDEARQLSEALQGMIPMALETLNQLQPEQREQVVRMMTTIAAIDLEPSVVDTFFVGLVDFVEQNDGEMFSRVWSDVFEPMIDSLDGDAIQPLVAALPRMFEGEGAQFSSLPRETQEAAMDATLTMLRSVMSLPEDDLLAAIPVVGQVMGVMDVEGSRRLTTAIECLERSA